MIKRRTALAALSTFAIGAGRTASGADARTLRIGIQKGSALFLAAKQNDALHDLGVPVQWTEFQFGPPMLEAMRVGSIDIGAVGDTPPIFAQVARADLQYVAATPSGGSAILVPAGSTLRSIADLKGRRIAFARGSSAHNLTVVALEKAGIGYADVQPVFLAPSDAAAAFERGSIDAWTIWDPYYAIHETRPGVRVLADAADIAPQNSFLMARQAYVGANPDVIAKAVTILGQVGIWAAAHRPEVAQWLAEATGVPPAAMLRSLERNPLSVLPMSEAHARSQQEAADRFRRLRLIPNTIDVRQEFWRAGA